MIEFEKKIMENFHSSKKNYENQFKSYHWDYQISKKENLYKIENLKDFRKNDLSKGLDDQFYSSEQTIFFFNDLIKEYGENYILNLLDLKSTLMLLHHIHKILFFEWEANYELLYQKFSGFFIRICQDFFGLG